MRIILICFSCVLLFSSCERIKKHAMSFFSDGIPVAEINGNVLYRSEIERIMSQNISPEDSIAYVENFIRRWAIRNLMYDKASRNLRDLDEIERLVADYRKSLLIHRYKQELMAQRLREPSESEIREYYDNNLGKFQLKENLIKGLYFKLPLNAPQRGELRSWLMDLNTDNLQQIEIYSQKNAIIYEYFGEEWVSLSRVLRRIPTEERVENILRRRLIEAYDEEFVHILYIIDYQRAGSVMPFELARDRIRIILRNINMNTYIRDFENDLYDRARERGDLRIHAQH